MEQLIILALVLYIMTTAISLAIVVWYLMTFGKYIRLGVKMLKDAAKDLEEEA